MLTTMRRKAAMEDGFYFEFTHSGLNTLKNLLKSKASHMDGLPHEIQFERVLDHHHGSEDGLRIPELMQRILLVQQAR
jgi:hypothetical protein